MLWCKIGHWTKRLFLIVSVRLKGVNSGGEKIGLSLFNMEKKNKNNLYGQKQRRRRQQSACARVCAGVHVCECVRDGARWGSLHYNTQLH